MARAAAGVGAQPRRRREGWLARIGQDFRDGERRIGYVLVLPALIVIAAVAFYPVVSLALLSLQHVTPNGVSTGFVGLSNYIQMAQDPDFRSGLVNTIVFTVGSVAIETVLGILVAVALNRRFAGQGIARAIALVPYAFPTVVSAVMWRLMFADQVGVVNYIAQSLHLIHQPILTSRNSMLVAAILVDAWKTTPFMALLLLAGLQTINRDVYQAAMIDGASTLQQFFRITLPLLKPALAVALLFRTLDAWRVYDLFWAMSDRQLESLSTFVYKGVRITQLGFSVGNAAAMFVFFSSMAIAFAIIFGLGARQQA